MPEMHLFIDTNAYLQFYRHTKDDAEILNTLSEHVERGGIVVHCPCTSWTNAIVIESESYITRPMHSGKPLFRELIRGICMG
jgi:hypothetical protein